MSRWDVAFSSWLGKNQIYFGRTKYEIKNPAYKKFIIGRLLAALSIGIGGLTAYFFHSLFFSLLVFLLIVFFGLLVHFILLPKDIKKYLHKIEKGE